MRELLMMTVAKEMSEFLVRVTIFFFMWYVSLSIWYSMSSKITEYLYTIHTLYTYSRVVITHSILSAVECCNGVVRFR